MHKVKIENFLKSFFCISIFLGMEKKNKKKPLSAIYFLIFTKKFLFSILHFRERMVN